jgi:hypothetical protein
MLLGLGAASFSRAHASRVHQALKAPSSPSSVPQNLIPRGDQKS